MTMAWSDGWVLLAAIYAGGGEAAPLDAVVAAADYINHAILTAEEMQGAVARLTAGGYAGYADGHLSPTEKTMAYYRGITRPRRPAFDELHDLLAFIRAPEPDGGTRQTTVGEGAPAVSHEVFNAAVERYLGRMRAPKRT